MLQRVTISIWSMYTDSSGDATLWLFPTTDTAKYTIRAEPSENSGYLATELSDVDVPASGTLTIALQSGLALTGRLLDGAGSPLSEYSVSLWDYDDEWAMEAVAEGGGGTDGVFTLYVEPGRYRLNIYGNAYDSTLVAPREFSITLTEALDIWGETDLGDLNLPVHRLDVHVQDPDGQPVSSVAISTHSGDDSSFTIPGHAATGNSYYWSMYTDSSGDATLWLFPTTDTAKYTIRAEPSENSGYLATELSDVDVPASGTLTIALQSGLALTGRLLDGAGGPLSEYSVSLWDYDDEWAMEAVAEGGGGTDGVFTLYVEPGRYRLNIYGNAYDSTLVAPGLFSITLTEALDISGETDLGDLNLPVHRLDVHVQDPDGQPVSSVTISTHSGDDSSFTIWR